MKTFLFHLLKFSDKEDAGVNSLGCEYENSDTLLIEKIRKKYYDFLLLMLTEEELQRFYSREFFLCQLSHVACEELRLHVRIDRHTHTRKPQKEALRVQCC